MPPTSTNQQQLAALSMPNERFQLQPVTNTCKISYKMKGCSSKMLPVACQMEECSLRLLCWRLLEYIICPYLSHLRIHSIFTIHWPHTVGQHTCTYLLLMVKNNPPGREWNESAFTVYFFRRQENPGFYH